MNWPRDVIDEMNFEAFESALTRSSFDDVLAGAIRFAHDRNLPDAEFIPHPTTWLNGDRWQDGPLPERKKTKEEQEKEWALAEQERRAKALEAQQERERLYDEQAKKVEAAPPKMCKHDKIVWNCRVCKNA